MLLSFNTNKVIPHLQSQEIILKKKIHFDGGKF